VRIAASSRPAERLVVTSPEGTQSIGWKLRKLLRFVSIYGPGRTWFKVAGRLRRRIPRLHWRRRTPDIGMIGCGQFAYATIGYFVSRAFGARFAACFDIDARAAATFARGLGVPRQCASADELLAQPGLKLVYVASNHASHSDYAVAALARGLDVYVEKPVAVTLAQLAALESARRATGRRVFAGYNRPFSAALRDYCRFVPAGTPGGISLQCFVSGHQLASDHWYRRPAEGTRICGNVGHWLDLFVHLLARRGQPRELEIALTWADDAEPDDNLSVSMRSDRGDLCSIMLSSRTEPFEGINETINLQHGDTICKIDDFRRLRIWQGTQLVRRRYWPKDVGHRLAILQPFRQDARDWQEVLLSTLLMLYITGMVREGARTGHFSFEREVARLESAIAQS
jgi:predicted dehydrogenase